MPWHAQDDVAGVGVQKKKSKGPEDYSYFFVIRIYAFPVQQYGTSDEFTTLYLDDN